MLQGLDLANALRSAMELKRARPGMGDYGPTALGKALGIKQPSASELLKTGRLAKNRLWALVTEFLDVVGPDHWGIPVTALEWAFLTELRALSAHTQQALLERVRQAAATAREAESTLLLDNATQGQKRHGRAA